MDIADSAQILSLAALLGSFSTWVMRQLARRLNIVNHPNPIVPQHRVPVAYLGGVGVALGAAGALIVQELVSSGMEEVILALPQSVSAILIGSILFLILGVVDDLREFRPLVKFSLQVAITISVVLMGLVLQLTGVILIDGIATGLWILTLVNAMNVTDVCDGLVGGLGTISFLALAFVNPNSSEAWLVLAGACLGFLVWNAPPASIFLGDAGSHMLGFLIAAGTVHLVKEQTLMQGGGSALLIAGMPLFELIFITAMRVRKGLPWWRGSPDHFSLRLQASGFSKWQTNLIAWSLGGIMAGTAVVLLHLTGHMQITVLITTFIGLSILWRILNKWEVEKPR